MQVTGYHTLQDRGNPEEIELNGPQACYRSNAWLGHGYYFWDTEIGWAHEWGKKDTENKDTGYMIFEAQLLIDEHTFDLFGNVAHQKIFTECAKGMKMQFNEKIVVPEVIKYLKKYSSFRYNSIRASDDPNPLQFTYNNKRTEQLSLNKRVQICLIGKTNLILDSFKVIFPERYLK